MPMQVENKIKVLVADDHELVRKGFVSMVNQLGFTETAGEAANGKEVIELLKGGLKPDLVLMDIEMPLMGGIETAAWIKQHFFNVHIIMLTMLNDIDVIHEALSTGAEGFLFKNSPAFEFGEAIKKAAAGENYYSSEVAALLLNRKKNKETNVQLSQLSEREKEIIILVAEGLSSNEISARLFISPRTVDTHRNNILQKLDLPNIASLVSFAYRNKLVK
jgi:DNA-binding NarL/FixJ family response regulator